MDGVNWRETRVQMVLISTGNTLSDRPSVYEERRHQSIEVMYHVTDILTYAITISPSRSFVS